MKKHKDVPGLMPIDDDYMENIFNVYTDSTGRNFYNLSRTINIPENLDPSVYFLLKLTKLTSLTSLSYTVYGTMHLWWLICSTNNINDTVRPIEPGTVLKIIHPSRISGIIKKLKTD